MFDIDSKECLKIVYRGISFVFGVFLIAICYNLFFLPNNLVTGGASGVGIIVEGLTGFNANIVIYIINAILLFFCYKFLGRSETKRTLLGSLLYPLFITFTAPIARTILPYFNIEEKLVLVVLAGIIYGLGNGIIYKCNFNTGGVDVIVKILNKYFHIQEGRGLIIINGSLIVLAGFAFGIDIVIYAIIILIISSIIVDKILIGISNNKMFLIYTKKIKLVSKLINEFKTGYTLLPTEGGYSHKKGTVILCALNNKDYVYFKERLLEIDPNAFFVINDCYEVNGGVKRSNLPFL